MVSKVSPEPGDRGQTSTARLGAHKDHKSITHGIESWVGQLRIPGDFHSLELNEKMKLTHSNGSRVLDFQDRTKYVATCVFSAVLRLLYSD